MNEKELFQQKMQTQLDELRAKVAVLKAKAAQTSADVQLKTNEHIKLLEPKIEEAAEKLSVLKNAGEDAWGSIGEGMESVWGTLKNAIDDVAAKFK